MSLKLMAVLNIDIFMLGIIACSAFFFSTGVIASEKEKLQAEREYVYSKMTENLGDKRCATAADCSIVPVGSMACGGPTGYIAYATSIGADKISQLKTLSERSKKLDKKLNSLSQTMGPCVYHSAPSLVCENQQCATSFDASNAIGIPTDVE